MARLDRVYIERYQELSRRLTRTIVDELDNGIYVNLKNPGNRASSPKELNKDHLVRFRVIARPAGLTVRGNRNLDLGHNEALLFLHGELQEDISRGMNLKVLGAKYRWAFGELLDYDSFITEVDKDFTIFASKGRDLIQNGMYADFISESMDILDSRINILRHKLEVKWYK